MSNPILDRVQKDAQRGYAGFRDTGAQNPQGYAPPQGHGQQSYYAPPQGGQQGYHAPPQGPGQQGYGQPEPGFGGPGTVPGLGGDGGGGGERAITLDDVMFKTGALFAVLLGVGAVSWFAVGAVPGLYAPIVMFSLVATIGLALYFAFSKKPVSPALAVVYAAIQGMFVGGASVAIHMMIDPPGTAVFESVVTQAVLATLCVFGAMLTLYKTGIIKVTEKFRSIVLMAGAAYFVFALINFGYAWFFGGGPFGFGGSGPLGIAISLFATGLAAVFLTLDFDNINTAITTGAPEKYSWTLATGLLATLVWLYIEMLRLLARLRSE